MESSHAEALRQLQEQVMNKVSGKMRTAQQAGGTKAQEQEGNGGVDGEWVKRVNAAPQNNTERERTTPTPTRFTELVVEEERPRPHQRRPQTGIYSRPAKRIHWIYQESTTHKDWTNDGRPSKSQWKSSA